MKNNKLFITLSSIFLIYTILGFIAIPKIAKPKIEEIINANITQKITIKKIEFNPFLLKFSAYNIKIFDKKTTTFTIDKILLDFSLVTSLNKKHINFKNLEIDNPYINIIQYENESFNLEKLIKPTKKDKSESNSNLEFQVLKTAIKNAKITFTKLNLNKEPYKLNLHNLNYTFYNIGTFQNILASHSFNALINKETKVEIKGGLRLNPFKMYGNMKLQNLKPNDYLAYKQDLFNFELEKNAYLDLDFGYKIDTTNKLKFEINKANFNLHNIDIKQNKTSIFAFKHFIIEDINIYYPKNSMEITKFHIDTLNSKIQRNKEGIINYSKLFNLQKKTETSKNIVDSWNLLLNEFTLANSNINFIDLQNQFSTKLNNLNIEVLDLLQSDKLTVKNIKLNNHSLDFKHKNNIDILVENLAFTNNNLILNKSKLSLEKTMLKIPNIKINDSKNSLNLSTKNLNLIANNTSLIDNQIEIKNFNINKESFSLNDIKGGKDILAKNIIIDIENISHKENRLTIANSTISRPYFLITLGKQNRKTNESKEEIVKKEKSSKKSDFEFDIGPVKIDKMTMKFEDKNLPIPFKTDVTQLSGEFSRLNSNSSKPTKLQLEGKVDKYGYTKITGTVDINDIKLLTNTNLLFKNIAIKNLTPYSNKFVGREIQSGKLNLDLRYNIKKSNLKAENLVIISDIKLGKEIKSKNAVNLPLEFAIALLEDSEKVIDIKLPITGNVDDPQFSIIPIVWKLFTNLIIKAISAPFTFLASVFGIDEEKIKSLDFEYGKSDIIVSEKESLDNIAKILSKKPKLAIVVKPAYNPIKDKLAIQNIKFDKYLENIMKKILKGDEYKIALEEIYKKEKNEKPLKEIKKLFINKKNKKFDNNSYVEFLRKTLASKQLVTIEELKTLATNRVKNIIEYLTVEKKLEKEAIKIEDIEEQTDTTLKWAKFNLDITIR